MPRSSISLTLLAVALLVVFGCGGPPKKASPPDKTTDLEVAKGTKTTDIPDPGVDQPGPATMTVDDLLDRHMGTRDAEGAPSPNLPPRPPAGIPVPGDGGVARGEYPEAPDLPKNGVSGFEPGSYPEVPTPALPAMPDELEPADYPQPTPRAPVPYEGDPGVPVEPEPIPAGEAPPEGVAPAAAPAAPEGTGMSEADRLFKEYEDAKRVELKTEEYLVGYYIDQAEQLARDLQYEEAEALLQKALARAPDNQRAISLYHQVLSAQGRRTGDLPHAKEEAEGLARVKQQEAQTRGNYYFNRGKKAFDEERYEAAIEDFKNVLTIMQAAPYGTNWGTLRADTEEFLLKAEQLEKRQDESLARQAAEEALTQVREDELRRRQEQEERVAKLFSEGLDAFENERFEIAENLAEQVLALDPTHARAKELLKHSVRARHRQTSEDLLRVTKERFREWRLDIQETIIPWSARPLHWPSQKQWNKTNRRAEAISDFGAGTQLSAEDQELQNRLSAETVTFLFDGTELSEALDFIRTLKNINLVVDDAIRSDLEGALVTLNVTELELDSALDLLLRLAGEEYTYVLRGGVVYITNREGARGEAILRVHSVGDLTIRLTNFIAPNLILKPAGAEIDESQPLFGKAEEGEMLIGGGAEDLLDLITQNIQPESWDEGGYTISANNDDKLVVVHTPEVQAEIARFLDDLRRFAGLVVTIETRFLTVNDEFLEDIGVDIRGLGGEKGPLVNLDDVTSGLDDNASAGFDNGNPGLPIASASNPSAGAFFNRGSDGDYRGRTEGIFDRALGQVLSPLGGAIIQYTFLDDTDISLILKAVEKSRHARFLQAPSLTVYNTQRANITLVNQLSFIQDYDVEVAQTAFIADPIVGIIQDGLALDVRPTISHDRKYVTLELQPTIATLIRPIPEFQTTLGALTTPVNIQLPELVIQKSQTTVRVPDGGSLVIGGLKNISLVDMQSEVPFLSKLPILNFFFSRRGSSREVENLMVIVTARITDLVEEEMRFRTPYTR